MPAPPSPARPAPPPVAPPRPAPATRRELAVARRRATALLVAVTVVFATATLAGADGAWAWVQAGAEASMVGGLADWFAVVALFRHPLGLPIPHTAVIRTRKDQFGATLGSFVEDNFLTAQAVVDRVRAAQPARRVAAWLDEPGRAEAVAGHAADAAVALADLLRDDAVHGAVEGAMRARLEATPLAPTAGRLLRTLTEDGRHRPAVDAALVALAGYVDEHRGALRARFQDRSPWWMPGAVEDRIFDRLIDGARVLLADMAADPDHELRRQLDARLGALVEQLEVSPELRARGEELKADLMANPALRAWIAPAWADAKATLRAQAADPGSVLRAELTGAVRAAGRRLGRDAALAASVDDGVEQAVRAVFARFSGEIAELVSGTIERWDADETSDRLELLLGRDLQYIRLNGTVVGGLAGLGLHAVAQALG